MSMGASKEIVKLKFLLANALNTVPAASGVVTRLNRLVFEPIIMPGQYIRIQQGKNAEIFQLSQDRRTRSITTSDNKPSKLH